MDACFLSNHKRVDAIRQESAVHPLPVILTSNISGADGENRLYVDYDSCTNDDEMVADNAGLMLLKLLKRCGVIPGIPGRFRRFSPPA